jgi:hypothetical protein
MQDQHKLVTMPKRAPDPGSVFLNDVEDYHKNHKASMA